MTQDGEPEIHALITVRLRLIYSITSDKVVHNHKSADPLPVHPCTKKEQFRSRLGPLNYNTSEFSSPQFSTIDPRPFVVLLSDSQIRELSRHNPTRDSFYNRILREIRNPSMITEEILVEIEKSVHRCRRCTKHGKDSIRKDGWCPQIFFALRICFLCSPGSRRFDRLKQMRKISS
jgi:hypothetical protein